MTNKMTTNRERAELILFDLMNRDDEVADAMFGDEYVSYTDALADAGLLAPDLPEPQVSLPDGEMEWSSLDGWVNLEPDGTITMVYDERDGDDLAAGVEIDPGELVFTRISEARTLALALLAATTPGFHPRSS